MQADELASLIIHIEKNQSKKSKQNASKRLPGLIIEQYIKLKAKNSTRICNPSFGWCYSKEGNNRSWYKITEINEELNNTDRLLIEKLRDTGGKFFRLTGEVSITYREDGITFDLNAYKNQFTIDNVTNLINESTHHLCKKKIHTKTIADSDPVTKYKQWLVNIPIIELRQLLLSRILLNEIPIYPTDVDIISIKNDKLSFHEVKRKYGPSSMLTGDPSIHYTIDYFKKIEVETTPISLDGYAKKLACTSKEARDAVYAETMFQIEENIISRGHGKISLNKRNVQSRKYGLDMSHLQNVLFCNQNDINYHYLVWDSIQQRNSQLKNDESYINDLECIIDVQFNRKEKSAEFFTRKISASDICGFSFTIWSKSGTYDNGVRIQAIFELPNSIS